MKDGIEMGGVRKVMSDGLKAYTGEFLAEFRNDTLYLTTDEENSWNRAKVEVRLQTDIEGLLVSGYRINYFSGSDSAEKARKVAGLLEVASHVAELIEKAGVPYKG